MSPDDRAKIDEHVRLGQLHPSRATLAELRAMRVRAGLSEGQAAALLHICRCELVEIECLSAGCHLAAARRGMVERRMAEVYLCGGAR